MAGSNDRSTVRAALCAMRRPNGLWMKVCHVRENFLHVAGARTFLSAATPKCSTGLERSRAQLLSNVAADKNVRAPLCFRLRRPWDSAPCPLELKEKSPIGPELFPRARRKPLREWSFTPNCGSFKANKASIRKLSSHTE